MLLIGMYWYWHAVLVHYLLIHCAHTLCSYTVLIRCARTLCSYITGRYWH
jgi:hypothetical protein